MGLVDRLRQHIAERRATVAKRAKPGTPGGATQAVRFRGPGFAPAPAIENAPPTDSGSWLYPPRAVRSSNLRRVAYQPSGYAGAIGSRFGFGSGVLEIQFQGHTTIHGQAKPGGVYHYQDVPASIYRGLLAATSKGKYFNRSIKNLYPFKRVG